MKIILSILLCIILSTCTPTETPKDYVYHNLSLMYPEIYDIHIKRVNLYNTRKNTLYCGYFSGRYKNYYINKIMQESKIKQEIILNRNTFLFKYVLIKSSETGKLSPPVNLVNIQFAEQFNIYERTDVTLMNINNCFSVISG